MTPVWAQGEEDRQDGQTFHVARMAVQCNGCHGLSYVVAASRGSATQLGSSPLGRSQYILDHEDISKDWFPVSAVSPKFPDVPDHVAQAAKEAHEAASIGANIAAILMARTVIEATAKAHGILKGELWKKIDALKDAQLIRPSAAEAAHEIRHLGNDMAHGDLADLPTAQDAADVLTLMDLILNEVFQATALTAAIKARRTAPKEG